MEQNRKAGLHALCDELLLAAAKASGEEPKYERDVSVALIKLKCYNRNVQVALEEQKREIDAKRLKVDNLQLNLENLRYKESYLLREIRSSRNVNTPNLNKVEKELNKKLGAHVYTDDMKSINEQTIVELQKEESTRIATNKLLDDMTQRNAIVVEKLSNKRKFLDELPGKVDIIAKAAKELEEQFAAIVDAEEST